MNGDDHKLLEQAKTREFELIELLFRKYISSHIAMPDIEYSFQARFQSFINQIPSYLHSSIKTGFFTHFFFGSFASLLDTNLGQKLGIQKLHFNFDQANHLRIVAEAVDKTHVFIFTENNQKKEDNEQKKKHNKQKKKHNKQKKIDFTKDEWKTITGQEYTDDNKKLEISVIQINKSTGSINAAVEKKDIQDGVGSTKYNEITKQFVDKDNQLITLEHHILKLSVGKQDQSEEVLKLILEYTKKIHDHYPGLPYGAGAKEADEHGFIAGIFNNFRYRHNAHAYLEQLAGKGYADIVLLVRGADRNTESIPIIIELKAGTGRDTNADAALTQAEEYTKGFQPNNMRILSLSDNILCVGVNLDMPTDSCMQMKVVKRDQEIVPLIQSITDSVKKIKDNNLDIIKQEIHSNLKKTYNTFPGTGEKSSAHYMSRFILGESLVLRDYDKHIFIYDEQSYIPTFTVINDHNVRFYKEPKIENIVDGSNAVNSILLISKDQNHQAIVLNIIDINREVNDVIKLPLDHVTVGNRKIISLDIEFRLDKSQKGFQQYCDVKIGNIYNSVLEYNNQNAIRVAGTFHKISYDDSFKLVTKMEHAIDSQKGLVIPEYTNLIGKIGEVVYPIKSLIGRESEFQGLLEGIFKYHSDIKLSEAKESERRELVITEFQTGAGGRIDMLVHAIGSSKQGTKEYIPVGLELKYDDSIKLDSFTKKQDQNIQQILLVYKEKQVVEKLLQDQTERYSKGAAIKSITDSNQIVIMGIVFNAQAEKAGSLLLIPDKFTHATVVHSSKLYTISDINDERDQLKEILITRHNFIIMENYNNIDVPQITSLITLLSQNPNIQKITISNSEITNDAMEKLSNVLQSNNMITHLSFINTNLDTEKAGVLINLLQQNSHIVYLDVTNNNLDNQSQQEINNLLNHNQRIHKKIKSSFASHKIDDFSSNTLIPDWVDIRRDQMRDNNIIVTNIDDIDNCYQDTALDLSNTMLEDSTTDQVVTWLKAHPNVDFLDLSNNQLSSVGVATILKYLIDTQNRISFLDISENSIDANTQAIIKLESWIRRNNDVHGPVLKFLNMHNIGICYDDAYKIFRGLVENTSIEHLDISSNNLFSEIQEQNVHYISDSIINMLCGNSVLSTLDLSNTGITNLVINGIVRVHKTRNPEDRAIHITELNIAGNHITQDGMESLGQLISSAAQLQSLDISNNHIGITNIHKLLNNLRYTKISTLRMSNIDLNNAMHYIGNVIKYSNIQILDISHNDIGTRATIDIFRAISHTITRKKNTLIQLNLSGNPIDITKQEQVIDEISKAVKNNYVLRSLDISDMNIQDTFLSQLALTQSNIENLNIAGNDISEYTILSLADLLSLNPPLKLLNISANFSQEHRSIITASDVRSLFKALSGNTHLTHIDLSYNNLDYESIDIISKYLQGNKGLEYLSLAHSNLSTESILVLFQGLISNNQLQYLDIRDNSQIDDDHALKILEILKVNTGLKILSISRHNFSPDVISTLTSTLLDVRVEIDGNTLPRTNSMYQNNNLLDLDSQTFETETKLHNYNYWLQQHDIADIGRVQYRFNDNGLKVISSIDQLFMTINNYKQSNNISPFTIICNTGNDNASRNHWVSVVLSRQDNSYYGYYIDSFGRDILGNIANILNSHRIVIVLLSIQQQQDGHNCGLWALENAQKIGQALQDNANTDLDTNSLRSILTSSRSENEWRQIRNNVYTQLINDNIRVEFLRTLDLTQDSVRVLDANSQDLIIDCLPSTSRGKRDINKCKIGWGDIDEISHSKTRNIDEIVLDAVKIFRYSKTIHDQSTLNQLVAVIKVIITIKNNNIVNIEQYLSEDFIENRNHKDPTLIGTTGFDELKYILELINARDKVQQITQQGMADNDYNSVLGQLKDHAYQLGIDQDHFARLENHLDIVNAEIYDKYIDSIITALQENHIDFDQDKFDTAKIQGAKTSKLLSIIAIYDLFDTIIDSETFGRHNNNALRKVVGVNAVLDTINDLRISLDISHNNKLIGKTIDRIPKIIRTGLVHIIDNPIVGGITFIGNAWQFGYSINEIMDGNHDILNYYWTGSSGTKLSSQIIGVLKVYKLLGIASKIISKISLITTVADVALVIGMQIHERLEVIEYVASRLPLSSLEKNELFVARLKKFFTGKDIEKEYIKNDRSRIFLDGIKTQAKILLDEDNSIAAVVQYVAGIEEKYHEIIKQSSSAVKQKAKILLEGLLGGSHGISDSSYIDHGISHLVNRFNNISYLLGGVHIRSEIVQYVADIEAKYHEIITQGSFVPQLLRTERLKNTTPVKLCYDLDCEFEEELYHTFCTPLNNHNIQSNLSSLDISQTLPLKKHILDTQETVKGLRCGFTRGNFECNVVVEHGEINDREIYVIDSERKYMPYITNSEYEDYRLRVVSVPSGKLQYNHSCNIEMPKNLIHNVTVTPWFKIFRCDLLMKCQINRNITDCQNSSIFSGEIEPFIFTNIKKPDLYHIKQTHYPNNSILYFSGPKTLVAAKNYPAVMYIAENMKHYYGSKLHETIGIINKMPIYGILEGGEVERNMVTISNDINNITLNINFVSGFIMAYNGLHLKGFLVLRNMYNYLSYSNSQQFITTTCETRYINAAESNVGNKIYQLKKNKFIHDNGINCTSKDYEIRVLHNKDKHFTGPKKIIFLLDKYGGNATIKYPKYVIQNKYNMDVISLQGDGDITKQIKVSYDKVKQQFNLSINNAQNITTYIKVNSFHKLVIQALQPGYEQLIMINDKSLLHTIEDMKYQIFKKKLGAGISGDTSIVTTTISVSKDMNSVSQIYDSYYLAKDIMNGNNLSILIQFVSLVQHYISVPMSKTLIGGIYSDSIAIDFNDHGRDIKSKYNLFKHYNITNMCNYIHKCHYYQMITVEGGAGQDKYIFSLPIYDNIPECINKIGVISLYLDIRNEDKWYQGISNDIVDLSILNITNVNTLKVSKNYEHIIANHCFTDPTITNVVGNNSYISNIIFDSHGLQWSLLINLVDYWSSPTYQHIIFKFNDHNNYKIDDTGSKLELIVDIPIVHHNQPDTTTPQYVNDQKDTLGLGIVNHQIQNNQHTHRHRHHHGENAIDHRGRRDIEHVRNLATKCSNHEHDDHLLDSIDDRLTATSAGSSLKPLGYNIVNWIRDSILLCKTLNPIRQVKNLFNAYNDKTKTIDLDISDDVGCKESQKQDGLVNKFSIVQKINEQIYALVEKKVAAEKLLRALCQQLNSLEKEVLRQEELQDAIINIYQEEEYIVIKQGDAQDKKQELYHIKEQIELQKSLIESSGCELNILNDELAMLNVEDNNLLLYHDLPYWNESLEEDVEVDCQIPIWMINRSHHINVDNLPNAFIGNNINKNQVSDDSLCDFQGTLLLWNLLMRQKYGVHYNHQHDIIHSEEVETEYAHRLAYSSYAPSVEKQEEDIELIGVV